MSTIDEMHIYELERKVFLLEQLADGCKKHRSYRAIRVPRADCERCRALYAARKELNDE